MKTINVLQIVLIICFWGTLANVQKKIPSDGLVAYYPFNNGFNDKSGNNLMGKLPEQFSWDLRIKPAFLMVEIHLLKYLELNR